MSGPEFDQLLKRGFKEGDPMRVCLALPPVGRDPLTRKMRKDDQGWKAEVVSTSHPHDATICLFVRRPLRSVELPPPAGQRSAVQVNPFTTQPKPILIRRPSLTKIKAADKFSNTMPDFPAYNKASESLKTVQTQVNAVARLMPVHVPTAEEVAAAHKRRHTIRHGESENETLEAYGYGNDVILYYSSESSGGSSSGEDDDGDGRT